MGKINVLSFAVANLIAAGEVVDRPASVIKELMENAIDAGARHITVEIQKGGVTFMRVADDGIGISKEDLPVAIKRHATSKIQTAEDLDGIATLGFRGEALAAIAAVSDLRILTRTKDTPYGYLLLSSGGVVEDVVEQGAPIGTTVIVENLFANVPARRKFLKKDMAETAAVTTYVEKIALSRPDIAIRLITDGNLRLDTAGDGTLESAMYAVFGRDFVKKMIPVKGGSTGVSITGFIGRPDHVRPKRNYQNFFINGRYINCRTAAAALEQAYTSFIAPEKFPCCVLNIEIAPEAVDVNVHPAKLEVKFSNEKPVFEAVYYAVRTALEENCQRPDMTIGAPKASVLNPFVPVEEKREPPRQMTVGEVPPPSEVVEPRITIPEDKKSPFSRISAAEFRAEFGVGGNSSYTAPTRVASSLPFDREGKGVPLPLVHAVPLQKGGEAPSAVASPAPANNGLEGILGAEVRPQGEYEAPARRGEITGKDASVSLSLAQEPAALPAFRIIGEAFYCYILVETEDKLLLIDKHAAHERVLFEELKERLSKHEATSQMLMLPLDVSLSRADVDTLELYRAEVEGIGFSFESAAHGVSLSEIPEGLTTAAAEALLVTLASGLAEGTENARLSRDLLFEKALYQGACKAAIKGGREYPPEYNKELCEKLFRLPDITVCPHGRPVAMTLTHAQIDRQFKRS